MTIIYRAEDGTEFDTYATCEAYESYCEKLPPSIRWYDKFGRELIPQNSSEVDKMYNDVDIWEIEDVPGWKEDLEHMIEYYGFGEREMKPGRYKYVWEYPIDEDTYITHEFLGMNEWMKLRDDE